MSIETFFNKIMSSTYFYSLHFTLLNCLAPHVGKVTRTEIYFNYFEYIHVEQTKK